ncbi:MAG: acyl-CoA synthetase FdrA [Granulosicoccus sp.]
MNTDSNAYLETRVRQQFYLDSVALMRLSRTLNETAGVFDAAMMMGTPANLEILSNASLLELPIDGQAESSIGPGDLILTVRAESRQIALDALDEAEQLLAQPQQSGKSRAWQPHSIRSAVDEHPESNLVLISVPGAFAISEARKAIRRGLHAMIFSDNVSVDDELTLKREAHDLGVLVMGPDCGTCVINGVPLAFANQLPRGDIGIVGASGTGIQEVSCLLAGMGKGISHAIGVGGRDMGGVVGGISTLMALDALESDDATRHIIVICKPPAPDVATRVLKKIAESSKTFTLCFIGGHSPELPANASWARTLSAAAEDAAGAIGSIGSVEQPGGVQHEKTGGAESLLTGSAIRGLFCGGTLCAEAQVICLDAGLSVTSNAAIPGVSDVLVSQGHTLLDLGSDEYTQGKPHPMIDPAVRDQLLTDALRDDVTAVVLLDVVLGYGAHADPAGQLVRSLPDSWTDSGVKLIASVTGTEQDPQIRSRQISVLQSAGIEVAASNAQATSIAIAHIETRAE